jgi:hypothetical protein
MATTVAKALGSKYSFKIKNSSANKYVIALFAAYFNTLKVLTVVDAVTHVATNTISYNDPSEVVAAGYACDAVLDDGEIITDVVCTSSNSKMSIRQFKNYIKSKGNIALDMIIAANNVDVFDETLEVIRQTPLDGSKSEFTNLSDHKSTSQYDQLKVEIIGIELFTAFDTLALLPIGAGREVTITFRFAYS